MCCLVEHDINDFPFCYDQGDKMTSNNFQENNECQIDGEDSTQLLRPNTPSP